MRLAQVAVLCALFAVFAVGVLLIRRSHAAHMKGPSAVAPEGRTYDFGEIVEGQPVEHAFRIANAGDEPLKILKIRSTCGCIKASASSAEIQPRGTGDIKVSYRGRRVANRDTIISYVLTNDPANPILQLAMTGRVRYRVLWFPESVSFHGKPGQIQAPGSVKFKPQVIPGESPAQIEILQVSSKNIRAQVIREEKGDFTLSIGLVPEFPAGSYVENVIGRCSSKSFAQEIQIPVYCMLY